VSASALGKRVMAKDPKTPEDFVRLFLSAKPNSDLRRAYLLAALRIEDPDFWQAFNNGKKGRPRGSGVINDNDALFAMFAHYLETGETAAKTLAHFAVRNGKASTDHVEYTSVVERLAKRWSEIAPKDTLPVPDLGLVDTICYDEFLEGLHKEDTAELIRLVRAAHDFRAALAPRKILTTDDLK
jgi:hypothetical protein